MIYLFCSLIRLPLFGVLACERSAISLGLYLRFRVEPRFCGWDTPRSRKLPEPWRKWVFLWGFGAGNSSDYWLFAAGDGASLAFGVGTPGGFNPDPQLPRMPCVRAMPTMWGTMGCCRAPSISPTILGFLTIHPSSTIYSPAVVEFVGGKIVMLLV